MLSEARNEKEDVVWGDETTSDGSASASPDMKENPVVSSGTGAGCIKEKALPPSSEFINPKEDT